MDYAVKDSYEISVWRHYYEIPTGETEKRWVEKKIFVIGSDERKDEARVFNPVFTTDIYGQETLKFDMYSKYTTEEGKIDNPYLSELYNEAYIKLKFRDTWHDFVIRERSESHDKNFKVSFTCESLAMSELGKTGYDLTFNEANSNNSGTAGEFLDTTLVNSGWYYERGSTLDTLEKVEEQGYKYDIEDETKVKPVSYAYNSEDGTYIETIGEEISLYNGFLIMPYSEYVNKTGYCKYFESEDDLPTKVPYSCGNVDYIISNKDLIPEFYTSKYRVESIQKNAKTTYNSSLERYIYSYVHPTEEDKWYGYYDYYNSEYVTAFSKTMDTLGIIVVNPPEGVFGYRFRIYETGGTAPEWPTPISVEAAQTFSELSADTSYTIEIRGYDNTESSATLVKTWEFEIKTAASEDEENYLTIEDIDVLESTLNSSWQLLYFKEGEESLAAPGKLPTGYIQEMSYEKIRTLEAEKSTRFNITQDIAELFELWCRYDIEYNNDGSIKYDSTNKRYCKQVKLVNEYGQDNQIGIHYGSNLQSITRTLTSEEIVTKLYVEDIDSDAAQDGICSIRDADCNPSLEDYILDFKYFIRRGLLDETEVYNDLYWINLGEEDPIPDGYYTKIRRVNQKYNTISSTLVNYGSESLNAKIIALQKSTVIDSAKIDQMTDPTEIKEAQELLDKDIADLNAYLAERTLYYNSLETLNKERIFIEKDFLKKYSPFIREGTWVGENYTEDNRYFYDAQKTASQNAEIKVSYSLKTIDISHLIDLETNWDYSPYAFNIGDISYIYDKELFGDDEEKVVISSITYNLDEANKNSIEIQNYTTQFKDLFSKLSATVQSYDLNKNIYSKADNFTGTGALTYEALQGSFNRNRATALSNFKQDITYDDTGITLKSDTTVLTEQCQVKIMSEGIVLSKNGGKDWITGIYAGEINTELLRAAQLDAANIQLYSDKDTSKIIFDDNGITGTKTVGESTITTFKLGHDGIVINSTDGSVGGWIVTANEIKAQKLKSGSTTEYYYPVGLYSGSSYKGYSTISGSSLSGESPIRFYAGVSEDGLSETPSTSTANSNFYVTESGFLYSKYAYISGTLKSATLDGSLKGTTNGIVIGPQLMIGLKDGKISGSTAGEDYNFWVDSSGNIVLDGTISFGSTKVVDVGYSSLDDPDVEEEGDWHEGYQPTDKWRREKYLGETGYHRFKLGTDTELSFESVNEALGDLFQKGSTYLTDKIVYSPTLRCSVLQAGKGKGYAQIIDTGLTIYNSDGYIKIQLDMNEAGEGTTEYPRLLLGTGTSSSTTNPGRGMVKKFQAGIWLGDSSAVSSTSTAGNGIFVNFTSGHFMGTSEPSDSWSDNQHGQIYFQI